MTDGHVGWFDFEPEPEVTGDGSGDPDKHILTIVNYPGEDNDEIAVIVHRTCDGKYPIDGVLADRKRRIAEVIVAALNAQPHYADQLAWTPEENWGESTYKGCDGPCGISYVLDDGIELLKVGDKVLCEFCREGTTP